MSSKKNLLRFFFIYVLFFSSLRFGVGFDYITYANEIIQGVNASSRYEPLSLLLMIFSHETHYQLFFIITSLLTLYPIYYICKRYSENPTLSFSLYLLVPSFFLDSLSTARFFVALAFSVLAFFMFINKKRCLCVIFFACAIGFHYSAIFAVSTLLASKIKIEKKIFFIIYIFSFVMSVYLQNAMNDFSLNNVFFSRLHMYSKNEIGDAGSKISIIYNLIALILFWMWNKYKKLNPKEVNLLILSMWGVVLWNLLVFDATLRLRLSSYFFIFLIILIPKLINCFARNRKLIKNVVLSFFILFFISSLYLQIDALVNFNTKKVSSFPYQTVFFKNEYIGYRIDK